MEFALTFGAVGDFLALISLINDIRLALDDCRGSNKTYRELIEGLSLLEKSLQQVEKIYQGPGFAVGLQDLGAIAQATVDQVCAALQEFRDKICSKYGPSLASGGSGNVLKDVTRKIQWKFEERDVEQFRAKVAGLTVSLNLLLDVTAVRLIQQSQETTAKRIDEAETNTTSVVIQYGQSIEKTFRFLGSRMISKLDFLSGLGVNLQGSASQILTMMFTMSKDLTAMGAVLLRLERGVNNGEHFVLEDATGRTFPIHLKTITSWEAFEFILNDRFKGRKGERRIRRKMYSLHESASHQEINRSATFEDAFVPYQKVDMSIVCKAPEAPEAVGAGDTGLSSCPWCHTVSPGKLGARMQCPTCKKNFTRVVIELDDDLVAPSPPPTNLTLKSVKGDALDTNECSECHQPKRSQSEHQNQRRKRAIDADSDSDEEDVAGLAHIILQTKQMRIAKAESKPREVSPGRSRETEAEVSDGSASPRYTSDGEYSTRYHSPSRERRYAPHATDGSEYLPRRPESPRYTSHGTYATANDSPIKGDKTPYDTAIPRNKNPKTKNRPPPQRMATVEDAKKYNIPAGYSLKSWDPTEEPIILLGSVFDANSIGKWIYDWSVYHYGAPSPISDMAGDMWLLLIQLAGSIKRSEEVFPKISDPANQELVDDFIYSGDRLMDRFRKLLNACEEPMLRTMASGQGGQSAPLGKAAGVEFIETMFGREHKLERTERFIVSAKLWNMRFEANCDDILRKPSAGVEAAPAPASDVGVEAAH
ncbi:hypothetical protein QBC40DRAFT_265582 [Triangularia verruculosa]|uniref:Ubiquitin-like domain-containing protein n=1 Tax=Triangularia verruculosa TaxID=2587418 RepID=A0AAN6XIA7_9PEZI|nr:hypothetical protein QBC40DRAFT_265582 [Triangularia verruculosa]